MTPALEGHPVAYFAPTYKMLAEVWREAKSAYGPVTARLNVQERRLELVTGGVVDFWSLDDPDPARGRKYKRVLIDEAAMIRHLEEAWEKAIRPTLTDFIGDAWFFSTPKGRNYYWQLFQRGLDPLQPEWKSWQMPTSANPYIDPGEIEAARSELPERTYQQEYMAEFLEDGGGVFRKLKEAATALPQDGPTEGHLYALGVDWGKHHDFTVLSLIDATVRRQVAIDRFNQIDWSLQRGRLMAMVERFKPHIIIPELNSIGEPQVEELVRAGLPVQPFTTTNASKSAIIEALSLAFEQDDLAILSDPVQMGELMAYEAERLPSGLLRYSAPDGQHDDTVMALALAWEGAKQPPSAGVSIDREPAMGHARRSFWRG